MERSAELWEYKPDEDVPNDPNQSHKFEYVQFKQGKIVMEDHSRIVLLNEARFIYTRVERLNYQHNPRGIYPFTFCDFRHSSLYYIDIVAQLNYAESGALYLTNSDFEHSLVNVRGYGIQARDCLFEQSKIQLDESTVLNRVQNSVFRYDSFIEDLSDQELYIYSTTFEHNNYPVSKYYARVTAKCSRFVDNKIAIHAYEGGEINLSTLYNGGYNYFDHNDYNVAVSQAQGLLMEDGYNQFYDGNIMNVVGTLDLPPYPCPPPINANNNIWTPHSGSGQYNDPNEPDQDEFDVTIESSPGHPGNEIYCHIPFHFGTVASIARCGEFDNPKNPHGPIETKSNAPSFPLISSPTYFDSIPFDLALKQSASRTTIADTINGDDILAADMYYELLQLAQMDSIPNDSTARIVDRMKWNSLGNYKSIIERLFADSIITRDENQSVFSPVVENYVSVLMAFTDSIKTPLNYQTQFRLELMKASLFKTIGKKNQALNILENMNFCEHDSLQKLILDKQIQNVTFDLMADSYGTDYFLIDSITFQLDSSIYQIPLDNFVDTTGFGSYIQGPNLIYYSSCNDKFQRKSFGLLEGKNLKFNVYPNPTKTMLEVQVTDNSVDMDAGYTFSIIDFTGKTMFSQNIVGIHSTLNLPKLASALYFYQIRSKGKLIEQGKISILN